MKRSKKAFLIYNPQAGTLWQKSRFEEAERLLQRNHFDFQLKETHKPGDATDHAREAVEAGMEYVFVLGGDGTVHETIQSLVGSSVILAILPNGTGNLFAHEMGIPEKFSDIDALVEEARAEAIDVGKANGRYFVLMTGMGLDALAVRDVDLQAKRWFGWWSYLYCGVFNLFRHKPFEAQIEFLDPPGETLRVKGRIIVVGNGKAYGRKRVQVTSRAKVDDGLLDLCIFQSQTVMDLMIHFFKVLSGTHLEDKQILYFNARRFRIVTPPEIPYQLDGDLCGKGPVEFSVVPRTLQILLPPKEALVVTS